MYRSSDKFVGNNSAGVWSPDGHLAAFVRKTGGDYSHPKPGTTLWTRDGRHILVVCNDGPHRDRVWAFAAAGGEPRKLDIAESAIGSMSLSSDNRLLFTGGRVSADVWTISNLLPATHGTK